MWHRCTNIFLFAYFSTSLTLLEFLNCGPYCRYTIDIVHGHYNWTIKRRHRHFSKMYTDLVIAKAKSQLPTSSREKIKCKIPSFPKRPEISVISQVNLERRRKQLEKFLQSIMNMSELRQEQEVLEFFEISIVSFLEDLGRKNKLV